MNNTLINTEKYSKFISEIERFIEKTRKRPKIFKGVVEGVDLSDNIITIKLYSFYRASLSKGSMVLINEENSQDEDIKATIMEVSNSYIRLEVERDPSRFEKKRVVIDTDTTNVSLQRLEVSIKKIRAGNINSDNVRLLDCVFCKNKPKYGGKRFSLGPIKLNQNQKEGVINAIRAEDFHLIIGPPGTGKTYVIEELVNQLVKRKQKLLVTAWTNLAVDNIIRRLSKKETKNLVRIGPINKIDPHVKKFSIYEKIKKHKDWKEVEKLYDIIGGLFKLIPKVRDERDLLKKKIEYDQNNLEILSKELGKFISEKEYYKEGLSNLFIHEDSIGMSLINDELDLIDKKSQDCLSLGNNLLQEYKLKLDIPEEGKIEDLKELIKRTKRSIFKYRILSILYREKKDKLVKLKEKYQGNKEFLEEIYKIQREYNNLKVLNDKAFNKIYPDGKGSPDRDALNFQFEVYKLFETHYLPNFRKNEMLKVKNKTSQINKEVYKSYIESLNNNIEILEIKIEGLGVESYIHNNRKEDLHTKYINLLRSLDSYKRRVNKLIKAITFDIVNKADIIAATTISSCHSFLDDIFFDVMIMDESSQVSSFISLLPLLKCRKFILVGDNKQLQPIEEEDINKEMNLSIFNRLFDKYPGASTLLSTQYRMHKTIADIASEIFYEGKLRTSKEVASRILSLKKGKHNFLNPKVPVTFVDTSKVSYYEDEVGSGCSNIKEAEYVAYIVSLFVKEGIKVKDIGVITPYIKQKVLIRGFLKDIKIKGVEVDTVHSFQGREKDIIIMSFARSKRYSFPKYKLRFIEDETLVNVAITRSKKKLILIGNSNTLTQSPLLEKVVNRVGKKNVVTL